jgi:hypothetical protein
MASRSNPNVFANSQDGDEHARLRQLGNYSLEPRTQPHKEIAEVLPGVFRARSDALIWQIAMETVL